MENIETYWAIANKTIAIINILIEGWLVYRFVKPFINRKSYCVGISYSLAMLVFYLVPQEMTYPYLLGIFVAWITMCLTERKKIKQKIFLAISMYLIRWMVYGVTLVLRDIMFALFINTPYMLTEPVKQLIAYIVVELIYYGVAIVVMWLVIKLIHKVYVNKKENISGKELILLFATLLTVMVGYFTFNFLSNVYVEDTGNYVWNVHPGYTFLRVIYQIVSFAAILIAVIIYQRIKEKQREENMNLLLAEQIENTKQHISEVEKLYGDIRALKHDMGNHISVLENLFMKNETEELEKYMAELFDVGAFNYIVKPIDDTKFVDVLCRAVDEWHSQDTNVREPEANYVMINNGGVHTKVIIEDIVYAEVFNRKVVIHKLDDEIEYYGKMSDLEAVAGDSFFRPHRAYLVNFKYVEKYDATTIYLEKGTALMAKQNYPDFVKKYMKYNQRKG